MKRHSVRQTNLSVFKPMFMVYFTKTLQSYPTGDICRSYGGEDFDGVLGSNAVELQGDIFNPEVRSSMFFQNKSTYLQAHKGSTQKTKIIDSELLMMVTEY